jgi:hypothetical protein
LDNTSIFNKKQGISLVFYFCFIIDYIAIRDATGGFPLRTTGAACTTDATG